MRRRRAAPLYLAALLLAFFGLLRFAQVVATQFLHTTLEIGAAKAARCLLSVFLSVFLQVYVACQKKRAYSVKKNNKKGAVIHSFKGETVDFFLKKSSNFVVKL